MSLVIIEPAPEVCRNRSSQGTPEAVRARIKPERRIRAVRPALISLAWPSLFWLLVTVGCAFAPWWGQIPLGFLSGALIAVLFVAGHDAAHGSLFPRRWMNRLAARWCLLPALHPLASWIHSHNRLHHAFTNIKEKDSSFPPLTLAEYRGQSFFGRWLTRRYRTWYGVGLYYMMEVWWKWELFPNRVREPKNPEALFRDRLLVFAFAACWIVGLCAIVAFEPIECLLQVLLGFMLPQAVWHWLIGFIIFQQHTHPRVPWYSAADAPNPTFFAMQVHATPYLLFPPIFRRLMLHIMEHTAHHTDPLVPHYHLEDAQHDLTRSFRKEMVRVIWMRRVFLETLHTCRLYDFENHRWLDYDGRPTTPSIIDPPGIGAAQAL